MIKIEGYSDDVLYVGLNGIHHEYDCFNKEVRVDVVIHYQKKGLTAFWHYGAHDAQWSVELMRLAEDISLPPRVRIEDSDCEYGVALVVDVDADDAEISVEVGK